jgi:hypothetical protein
MDEVEIPEVETRVVLRPAVAIAIGVVVGIGVGIAIAAALTAVGKEYAQESSVVIEDDERPEASVVIDED